jgi:Predicted molecular chaperone distantly related to HSP70-fold metalloproteases
MKTSFDIKDFNLSFVKKLSLKDGAATLIEVTLKMILPTLKFLHNEKEKLILCGGGRKNLFLVKKIKKKVPIKIIDDYGIDGDFIESQAFGYLAIRSFLKLPISFPNTTGCKKPCTGGVLVKNY